MTLEAHPGERSEHKQCARPNGGATPLLGGRAAATGQDGRREWDAEGGGRVEAAHGAFPDRRTARPKPRRARPRQGVRSRCKLFIAAAALLPTRHFRLGHGGRRSRGTCTMLSRTRARKYRGSVYLSYFAVCFPCYFLVFLLRCYCTAFRRGHSSRLRISLCSSYHFNNSFSPKL